MTLDDALFAAKIHRETNGKTLLSDPAILLVCEHLEAEATARTVAEIRCKVDGPVYNAGRSEGHADVAARLRAILDPEDTEHWNLDGLLAEVARLRDLAQCGPWRVVEAEKSSGEKLGVFNVVRRYSPPFDRDMDALPLGAALKRCEQLNAPTYGRKKS